MSLLNKAKASKGRVRNVVPLPVGLDFNERLDLVLAYIRGDISATQCLSAIDIEVAPTHRTGKAREFAVATIKEALKRNLLKKK